MDGICTAMKLPFHTTSSEQRLIADLLAVAERRKVEPPDAGASQSAAGYLATLEEFLFPETAALIRKREEILARLKTSRLNVTFDRSLETAQLTMHAVIRNEKEYRELLEKLNGFDFAAWQIHCDAERQHAD